MAVLGRRTRKARLAAVIAMSKPTVMPRDASVERPPLQGHCSQRLSGHAHLYGAALLAAADAHQQQIDVDAGHLAVFSSLLGKAARHVEVLYVHTVCLVQVHLAAVPACMSLSEMAMMGAAVSPVNQCHAERCIAD